eukprot:TRINITY_DN3049_c0_g1_i5.p1 TRINITY_DN3049_c0_g1~~TRINITY_DN3049_c0_g1_i5.p1  ORF type:complete len:123 (+),score=15.20 TRINITY_DN3049_c0_g1_i5:368-736(+)
MVVSSAFDCPHERMRWKRRSSRCLGLFGRFFLQSQNNLTSEALGMECVCSFKTSLSIGRQVNRNTNQKFDSNESHHRHTKDIITLNVYNQSDNQGRYPRVQHDDSLEKTEKLCIKAPAIIKT